jgi:hypothetical protein
MRSRKGKALRRRLRFLLFDDAIPRDPFRWMRHALASTDRRSRLLDIFSCENDPSSLTFTAGMA